MNQEGVARKEYIFGHVEPVPTAEMLGNYWRFLKSITETERLLLGPVEIVLKSRAVGRGWPVALKNHVMALSSEAALSPKSAVILVDISDVSTVTFFAAHLVLPLLTDGAVARSPFARKMTHQEATHALTKICEEIRAEWSATLYFEQDPTKYPVDELVNLVTVLTTVRNVIVQLQETPRLWAPFQECSGLHIVNETDAKGIEMIRRPDDQLELSFRFARALPSSVSETLFALFNSVT